MRCGHFSAASVPQTILSVLGRILFAIVLLFPCTRFAPAVQPAPAAAAFMAAFGSPLCFCDTKSEIQKRE